MDKSKLLAERFPEGEVEIEGIGAVRVRGLSRWEMMTANKIREDKGDMAFERWVLARAMVDPAMSEDEVAQWQKVSPPMEINAVAMKVNELSGISPGAEKAAVKSVPGEPE